MNDDSLQNDNRRPTLPAETGRPWTNPVGCVLALLDQKNIQARLQPFGRQFSPLRFGKYLAGLGKEAHLHAWEVGDRGNDFRQLLKEPAVTMTTHFMPTECGTNIDSAMTWWVAENLPRFGTVDGLLLLSGDGTFTAILERAKAIPRLSAPLKIGAVSVPSSRSWALTNYLKERSVLLGEDLTVPLGSKDSR